MDSSFFLDLKHCLPQTSSVIFYCRQKELAMKLEQLSISRMNDRFECSLDRFIQLNLSIEEKEAIEFLSIQDGSQRLFEAYDGLEFGVYSKDLCPSQEFIEKYLNADICTQASDW